MALSERDARKNIGDGVMIPSPIFFALGWLGGKAVFRSEVGKWRFSMTKFELAKEYEVVEA